MIITKLISGLGNQLFQYAIARQISIQEKTPLKLDLSFFRSSSEDIYASDQLTRSFKLDKFNINAQIASEKEIKALTDNFTKKSFYAKIYRKAVRLLPRYRWSYFKEKDLWVYDNNLFKTTSNVYLEGYWQHYKYFENISSTVFDELTLKNHYQNAYKTSIDEDESSISIHIRRGDYVGDNFFTVQPLSYYLSAIGIISEKVKSPSFYIFSDDLDWAERNLGLKDRTTYVKGLADYIDLDLMSRCRHNIIANSSFSWWAAMLNKNSNKTVIAPSKWVLPPDINKRIELAFPSWIKL